MMEIADVNDSPEQPLVVTLAYDGLCSFEFGISLEVFAQHRPEMQGHWFRHKVLAVDDGPLSAMGGIHIQAEQDWGLLDTADLIVIPGWRGIDASVPTRLRQALQQAAARGAKIASICSGAFVLARCGLLDGRRATSHWRYTDALQQLAPTAQVQPNDLYCADDTIYTSAGSAAGLDLCLALVRDYYGAAAANKVAKRLVLPAWRAGGQAQFIDHQVPVDTSNRLAAFIDDLRGRIGEAWTVDQMATAAGMSKRSFIRYFEAATGDSPALWLNRQRIDRACMLLETTDHSIERIATLCGFAAVETLRHQFRRQRQVTPLQWRRAFWAKPADLQTKI